MPTKIWLTTQRWMGVAVRPPEPPRVAEATSRYWVLGGRREAPVVLSRRVADMAWAGLRGVRR